MVKKSDAAKANKPRKPRSPKEGRAPRSSAAAQPDKADDRRKKDRDIKPSAGKDQTFDDIEKVVSARRSKGGCLPKILMMFLLFSVVGTYFYLSS